MNDRFTIMQRVGRSALENDQKVSMVPNTDVSVRNRFLLEQLERKHKLRTALQIKRVRSQGIKRVLSIKVIGHCL